MNHSLYRRTKLVFFKRSCWWTMRRQRLRLIPKRPWSTPRGWFETFFRVVHKPLQLWRAAASWCLIRKQNGDSNNQHCRPLSFSYLLWPKNHVACFRSVLFCSRAADAQQTHWRMDGRMNGETRPPNQFLWRALFQFLVNIFLRLPQLICVCARRGLFINLPNADLLLPRLTFLFSIKK